MKIDSNYDSSGICAIDQGGVFDYRQGGGAGHAIVIFFFCRNSAYHPADHHPGVADRRVLHHVCVWLHHQYADAAGDGTGGRPGGGRCDRGAGKHLHNIENGIRPECRRPSLAPQIGFAVIATNADAGGGVFAPLAFATGRGRLFIEFALALAGRW